VKGKILIVDDDREMCEMLELGLKQHGFEIRWTTAADEALRLFNSESFDTILTDIQMPGLSGTELCRRVAENRPDIPVIVITAFGSFDTAVAALRAGAYDFVSKPIDVDTIAFTLERAVKHRMLLEQVNRLTRTVEESQRLDELIGSSESMQKVYSMMRQVSGLDSSVLITGESGTGKELVAQALHKRSPRKDGPFIPVNCAAMPETLLENELFGHTSGAYTSARGPREGLFVKANSGSIFLDEIADMPLALQPKILRAIEERKVRPVGSNAEKSFDVRLITATNRDLESAVEEGLFREDLYYRVNVIQIDLPPLRARGNDVLLLAQEFLRRFAAAAGKHVQSISVPAAERLLAYSWPGNVRELRNCIERAVALTQHDKIVVTDLPEKVQTYSGSRLVVDTSNPSELITMEEVEHRYIAHVLQAVGGNKTHAAQVLGFDRKTLYRKLERYRIETDTPEASP
jgi:two-component system response regulator AtoC